MRCFEGQGLEEWGEGNGKKKTREKRNCKQEEGNLMAI
jgi:hypothetical protein